MNNITYNYDKEVNAFTLTLSNNSVEETKEYDNVLIDYDAQGNVVSIEILDFDTNKL